mmetsp:Transcript_8295/g.1095  ORF Transcript_8295/g.1095 Transcript_8295/m.1095 type:complete len:98 (+) Transcript_8295:585-878(+)
MESLVLSGSGKGIVLATGKSTIIGLYSSIIYGDYLERNTTLIDLAMMLAVIVILISTFVDYHIGMHNGMIAVCVMMSLLVKTSENYFYCLNFAASSI